jgi:hypothetical protein
MVVEDILLWCSDHKVRLVHAGAVWRCPDRLCPNAISDYELARSGARTLVDA